MGRSPFEVIYGHSPRHFGLQTTEAVPVAELTASQSSVTSRSNQKLSFRFFGPYVILECIGQVAYKLKLPESALIHPVFHVSQLKYALGRRQVVVPHLPFTNDPLQVPVQVVDRRMIQRNRTMIAQVKVVWSGMDAELATWEDAEALYNRFPRAPAWGQAVIEERGNVSTKGEQALSE